ncbi:MAG: Rpn family recombination-promoting nuclease/putative transposase [Pusillimonas sp.]
MSINDSSYKLLFSSPDVVRDLIMGFIPDDWLHSLDYTTLEKAPGSYITDDLRQRADDVIWRVKANGQWVYLYLLIEFQSKSDPWMPVRMMVYVGLLYQDVIRRGEVLPGNRLPPVLPIVLYNGAAPWKAATDIADLIPRAPGLVANYLPQLKYLLIELNQYTDETLTTMRNLVAAIIRVEHPASSQALFDLIDLLNDWLADNHELRRIFAIWIRAVVLRRSRHAVVLPKIDDLKELKMTLTARFETWAEEFEQRGIEKGIQKGIEKGIQQGAHNGIAEMLHTLLQQKFGDLPDWVNQRLQHADTAVLQHWVVRIIHAESLHDVFDS